MCQLKIKMLSTAVQLLENLHWKWSNTWV